MGSSNEMMSDALSRPFGTVSGASNVSFGLDGTSVERYLLFS